VRQDRYPNNPRGGLLIELAALLRTNRDPRQCPSAITFACREGVEVADLAWREPPAAVTVPVTARRGVLPRLLEVRGPWAPAWPAEVPVGLPEIAPDDAVLVFADLLDDLGETAGGFDGHHPEQPLVLHEITFDGGAEATLQARTDDGRSFLTLVPLRSGADLIGATYNVVEWIVEGRGRSDAAHPSAAAVMDWRR
jgi:hypothetical protein